LGWVAIIVLLISVLVRLVLRKRGSPEPTEEE
jgi:hypothetical protein